MNPSIIKFTPKAAGTITLGTIFLFPLLFLPITPNFFDTNKLLLLIVATALLLILWSVQVIATRSIRLELLPFSLPLTAFGLMHFISSFISNPQTPAEALMGRGSFFLALGLFVTAAGSLIDNRRFIKHAINTLIGSGTVLAVISVFQSFGFGVTNLLNRFVGTTLPDTLAFTPAGSPVALVTFLIPVTLLALFLAFTKTEVSEKISLFVLSAIMSTAVIVSLMYSLPGKDTSPVFLPLNVGYAIAIETLKTPKTALLGVGTNSFVNAYNQLRPASMNLTDFWNIRFSASTNEILQILTTVGLIGLALFGWLISTMIKAAKTDLRSTQAKALKFVAFGLLFFLFLLPGTFLIYFALAITLLLWGIQVKLGNGTKTIELHLDEMNDRPQTVKLVTIYASATILLCLVAGSIYFSGRAYAGELTFKRSLDAAAKNDGLNTYNLQRQAVLQNPLLPRYRRAYSATNLAIANALAGNKDITDQDKQNVAQLIQQSIREAKVAVTLEPQNVTNWENLTLIYRSLISAASGADQWTIAALSQAILTDSVNPSLRVDLGGVYYSLGKYDQAIRLFQQAAELKPNYANAFYNLSHAYLMKKEVVSAYDNMRQTLSLVKPDSADYTKAQSELAELSKQLPKSATQASGSDVAPANTELQAPSPAPSPATPLTLPAGSGPENATTTTP